MLCSVHVLFLLVVLAGFTQVLAVSRPITEACTKIGNDPCRCRTESNQIIDLSPLDSGHYLHPKFKDIPVTPTYTNSTDLFSWNPCTPFCEMHCEGAATCQNVSKSGELFYTIGKHKTAEFTVNLTSPFYNTTDLTLTYTFRQSALEVTKTSLLRLLCDEDAVNDTFIAYGEIEPRSVFYYFEVISKHACPHNVTTPTSAPTPTPTPHPCPHPWTTPPNAPTTPEMTASPTPTTPANPSLWDLGWKLWVAVGCLSVVVLALIYFVIGLSINLIRGRRGMAVVPQYLCWISMCSCCKCCTSCQRRDNRRLLKEYTDDIS